MSEATNHIMLDYSLLCRELSFRGLRVFFYLWETKDKEWLWKFTDFSSWCLEGDNSRNIWSGGIDNLLANGYITRDEKKKISWNKNKLKEVIIRKEIDSRKK